MYVCVCNAIRESELREIAVARLEITTEEAYELLGAELDCNSCLAFADSVMADARLHPPKPSDQIET